MRKTSISFCSALLALSLAMVGCGADHDDHADHEEHHHSDVHVEGATETSDASPRIAVATETGVTLLDSKLEKVAELATTSRPTLTLMHDGRHIAAVQTKSGLVDIVDSGTWAMGHGDHFHFFTADAKLNEPLKGTKPIHVVPNTKAHATGVFFDDDGAGRVLDDHVLEEGHSDEAATVKADGPQHGIVVPLTDGSLVSAQAEKLPNAIEMRDANGAATKTFECREMHGEAVIGNTAAFGCVDSILIVSDGEETRVANPDNSGERVGGLIGNADGSTFVGDWADTSLVFISDGKAKVVEVGVEYSNRAVTPDGRFVVLGTDGDLRLYDASGKELQKIHVTDAWQKPTTHGGVSPSIAAGEVEAANTVWVSDPNAGKVYAVDLFANQVTSADVAGNPASIAVANAS